MAEAENVAFIGKLTITESEQAKLEALGLLLHLSGHTMHMADAPGANYALTRGVVRGGGSAVITTTPVEQATETIMYVDNPLFERFAKRYPEHAQRAVRLKSEDELESFVREAMRILVQRGLLRDS